MKKAKGKSLKHLTLGFLSILILLLTGCPRNTPTPLDATWNDSTWDNSTWQ